MGAAKATAAASPRLQLLVHAGLLGSKRPKQSHDIDLDSEDTRAFSYLECTQKTPSLDHHNLRARQALAFSHVPFRGAPGPDRPGVGVSCCNRPWFVFWCPAAAARGA